MEPLYENGTRNFFIDEITAVTDFQKYGVVVIPSSIHEMLILSADILELERMEELTKMVQDVNANEVLVREQLSDRAYILDI